MKSLFRYVFVLALALALGTLTANAETSASQLNEKEVVSVGIQPYVAKSENGFIAIPYLPGKQHSVVLTKMTGVNQLSGTWEDRIVANGTIFFFHAQINKLLDKGTYGVSVTLYNESSQMVTQILEVQNLDGLKSLQFQGPSLEIDATTELRHYLFLRDFKVVQ